MINRDHTLRHDRSPCKSHRHGYYIRGVYDEGASGEDQPKVPWEDCTEPSQTAMGELDGLLTISNMLV